MSLLTMGGRGATRSDEDLMANIFKEFEAEKPSAPAAPATPATADQDLIGNIFAEFEQQQAAPVASTKYPSYGGLFTPPTQAQRQDASLSQEAEQKVKPAVMPNPFVPSPEATRREKQALGEIKDLKGELKTLKEKRDQIEANIWEASQSQERAEETFKYGEPLDSGYRPRLPGASGVMDYGGGSGEYFPKREKVTPENLKRKKAEYQAVKQEMSKKKTLFKELDKTKLRISDKEIGIKEKMDEAYRKSMIHSLNRLLEKDIDVPVLRSIRPLISGTVNTQLDFLSFANMLTGGKKTDEVMNLREEYEDTVRENPIKAANTVEKIGNTVLEILPPMLGGMALSAPTGGWGGSIMWAIQGAGDTYQRLLDEGVGPGYAALIAVPTGVAYSAIESAQVGQLFGKNALALARRTAAESVKKSIAQQVRRYGFNTARESILEEGGQEALIQTAKEIGRAVSNETGDNISEITNRIGDSFLKAGKEAVTPMGIIGLFGLGRGIRSVDRRAEPQKPKDVPAEDLLGRKAEIEQLGIEREFDEGLAREVEKREPLGQKEVEPGQKQPKAEGKSEIRDIEIEERAKRREPILGDFETMDRMAALAAGKDPLARQTIKPDPDEPLAIESDELFQQAVADIAQEEGISTEDATKELRGMSDVTRRNYLRTFAKEREATVRAQTDPLTGLMNRKGLQDKGYLDENNDHKPDTEVMVLDVDNFKFGVNEPYGHRAGDNVLATAAEIFRTELDALADVGRYGGEEITVYPLPNVDKKYILNSVEEARKKLAQVEFEGEGGEKFSGVTFTAGFGDNFEASDALLREAKDKNQKARTLTKEGVYAENELQPTPTTKLRRRAEDTEAGPPTPTKPKTLPAESATEEKPAEPAEEITRASDLSRSELISEAKRLKVPHSIGADGNIKGPRSRIEKAVDIARGLEKKTPPKPTKQPAEAAAPAEEVAPKPKALTPESTKDAILAVMNKGLAKDRQFTESHGKDLAQHLQSSMDAKSLRDLRQQLHPDNKGWRAGFEHITGTKLPKTVKGTEEAIKQFVGEAEYEKQVQELKEAREARIKEREEKARVRESEAAQKRMVRYQGKRMTAKEYIDSAVSDGFTEVKAKKIGAATRYALHKPGTSEYLTLQKNILAYAQETTAKATREAVEAKPEEEVAPPESAAAGQAVETDISEAQKKAGNYKKAHVQRDGMDISIENPVGSERSGVDPTGKAWTQEMKSDYGYIKGSMGFDKDHVDVFIKPDSEEGGTVYVVNQVDPKTRKFDEHKAMMGFTNEADARKGYLANYEKGWKGLESIVPMSMDQFKEWALSDAPKKGAAEVPKAEPAETAKPTPSPVERVPGEFKKGDQVSFKDEVFDVSRDYKPGDKTLWMKNVDTGTGKTIPATSVSQVEVLTGAEETSRLEDRGVEDVSESTVQEGAAPLEGESAQDVRRVREREPIGEHRAEDHPDILPGEESNGSVRRSTPRSGTPGRGGKSVASERERPTDPGREPETGSSGPGSVTDHTDSRHNFRITDDLNLGKGGIEAKYRDNVAAIRLLKEIESKDRLATPEEQRVLAKYVGWGAFGNMFAPKPTERWAGKSAEIKELLTPEEFKAASVSAINAHYTSPDVIRSMWQSVAEMGFAGGAVLEPGMGVGNFFGMVPENIAAAFTGVEMDLMSGRIAKQLYQRSNIVLTPFEKFNIDRPKYDLVIGNVPFSGEIKPFDPNAKRYGIPKGTKLHNFFFLKSLYGLKPGGVMATISTHWTMDAATNIDTRKRMAEKADFLGAVRLPQDAFKGNAGTEVVTDILFFQKRAEGQPMSDLTKEFIGTEPITVQNKQGDDSQFARSLYYTTHPDMILGREAATGTQYAKDQYNVESVEGVDIQEALQGAIAKLPKTMFSSQVDQRTGDLNRQAVADMAPENVMTNEYYLDNDRIFQKQPDGSSEEVTSYVVMRKEKGKTAVAEEKPYTLKQLQNIKAQISLKAAAKNLLAAQYTVENDADLAPLQQDLSRLYDAYVAKYGPVNKNHNRRLMEGDMGASFVRILEKYDPITKKATKTDIFTKRLIPRLREITKADSVEDGYILSLAKYGAINVPYISRLTGLDAEEITRQVLESRVTFRDPVSRNLVIRENYLSGNVRQKYRDAQAAQERGAGDYTANMEELRKVVPTDLTADDISVRINSKILEPQDIEAFLKHLTGANAKVTHQTAAGMWFVESGRGNDVREFEEWGTRRKGAASIVAAIINGKSIVVRDKISQNPDIYEVNKEETTAANQKADQIQNEFQEWLWTDTKRTQCLTEKYNEEFRSNANPVFDGSWMKYPGMNALITMRPHQKNAIWRILRGLDTHHNTMLAHVVGSGKTFTMISSVMEAKRMGKAGKAMVVVPNHLTEQWLDDFNTLYPGAKVLVATDKNMKPENRRDFMNRVAFGAWDAVIVKQSHFKRMPIDKQYEANYLKNKLDQYEQEYRELYGNPSDNKSKKRRELAEKKMQEKLEAYRNKIEELLSAAKEEGVVTFDNMGVDMLLVDEADIYKNLDYHTQLEGVLGLGSQRGAEISTDMAIKVQFINDQRTGGGIVFATGTPVSNTLAESYHMMRYLQPEDLDALGLTNFDEWRSMFADHEELRELSSSGMGHRIRKRFSVIRNVPDLMSLLRKTWDIITSDNLARAGILVPGKELPNVKRITIAAPATDKLLSYREHLAKREADLADRKGPPQKGEDNVLSIIHDGQLAAIDLRMVNPNLKDDPHSKLNMAIDQAAKNYKRDAKERLTGLIFYDKTAPGSDTRFDVYAEIKRKLIAKGVKPEEIAFIHDANTDARKKKLFDRMNQGDLRILIGNTQKMGAGTNVQAKLKWLIHLDAPWRPRDIEQQEGRIIRQGNSNNEIEIYNFVTQGTLDSWIWGLLETKAKTISQIMTGDSDSRELNESNYGQPKIYAIDNPVIKESEEVHQRVEKLLALQKAHNRNKARLSSEVSMDRNQISGQERLLGRYQAMNKTIGDRPKNDTFVVAGKEFAQDQKGRGKAMDAIRAAVKGWKDIKGIKPGESYTSPNPLGTLNGLPFYGKVEKLIGYEGEVTNYTSIVFKVDALSHSVNVETNQSLGAGIARLYKDAPAAIENINGKLARLKRGIDEKIPLLDKPFTQKKELNQALKDEAEIDVKLQNLLQQQLLDEINKYAEAPLPKGMEVVTEYRQIPEAEVEADEMTGAGIGEQWIVLRDGERYLPNTFNTQREAHIAAVRQDKADNAIDWKFMEEERKRLVKDDYFGSGMKTAEEEEAEQDKKKRDKRDDGNDSIDDYLDDPSPQVGMSLRTTKARKKASLVVPEQYRKTVASEDPETERRLLAAEGLGKVPMIEKIRGWSQSLRDAFTKSFPFLEKGQEKALNTLRIHREVPQFAKFTAMNILRQITAPMNPLELRVFKRKIITDDLLRDVQAGLYNNRDIPFYRSKDVLERDNEKYTDIANANSEIAIALQKRQNYMRDLKVRLVDAGLLNKSVLEDDRYFHHQVLSKMAEKQRAYVGSSSSDVRVHTKGYQRKRVGFAGDYNTDYFESEFEWLSQAHSQLATMETLAKMQSDFDIVPDLKERARAMNLAKMQEILGDGFADAMKPFRQRIAMAKSSLGRLAEDGELDGGGYFDGIVEDLATPQEVDKDGEIAIEHGATDDARFFDFLSWLIAENKPGQGEARMIFKAIRDRIAFMKAVLDQDYRTYENIVPKGYALWQPKEGNVFYRVKTVSDKVLARVLAGEEQLQEADVKQELAMGGKLPQWAIPDGVAKTMDQFNTFRDEVPPEKLTRLITTSWKQYILLNPVRAMKYNLNNFSGDLDIAIAYNPAILKEARRAATDLWNFNIRKRTPIPEIQEALRLGVVDSGLTVAEIPDIKDEGFFRVMTGQEPNLIEKYWENARDYTRWRENILRLSAYRWFKKEIQAGATHYGASKRDEVDAIWEPNEKAAKLARDLMGDYGNISRAGQWLRSHMLPFYSWVEINAPRYWRLFKNLPSEQAPGKRGARTAAVAASAIGRKGLGLIIRMQIFYALVNLWNHLRYPEEEKELYDNRRQLHLILGRREDGTIRSLRVQGAFSDAMELVGLSDYPWDIYEVISGATNWTEKAIDVPKALVNRMVNMVTPFIKTPAEMIAKKSTYPDVFRLRPIRDRLEHAAKMFSLAGPYRRIAGKPMRKETPEQIVGGLLIYYTDPGESAYYETMRLKGKYLEKQGEDRPDFGATKRSTALYNYRRAKQWGDQKAEAKYLQKYIDLGGKKINLHQAERRQHPIFNLPQKYRKAFLDSLDTGGMRAIDKAIDWYQKVYGMDEPDPWQLYVRGRMGQKLTEKEKGMIRFALIKGQVETSPKWLKERLDQNILNRIERFQRLAKDIEDLQRLGGGK